MPLADPDGQSFQAFPPLCLLSLQLSQSLGNAGTCAEGQMGTDRARCIRMPQFVQRRQISLARAQKERKPGAFAAFFSLYNSSSTRRQGQCEGVLDTVKCTDTETPKQNREIVSSRCATVTAQSFFGGGVQSKRNPTGFQTLRSTAHRARLLFAHKVRYEVKLVLSQEELGQLLNAIQPKLQHQRSQNFLVDQIHVHAV